LSPSQQQQQKKEKITKKKKMAMMVAVGPGIGAWRIGPLRIGLW